MRFVIENVNDPSLLWSNDEGFTDSDNFEVYSLEESENTELPIDGQWSELVPF